MIVDVSGVADVVRRLDESSTLRSFAAVLGFLLTIFGLLTVTHWSWQVGAGDLVVDDEDWSLFALIYLAVVAASLAGPWIFVLHDRMARKPWRSLAAIVGATVGAFAAGVITLVLGQIALVIPDALEDFGLDSGSSGALAIAGGLLIATLVWLFLPHRLQKGATTGLAASLGLVAIVLLWAAISDADSEQLAPTILSTILLLGTASLVAWLIVRTVRMRIVLSGRHPRELLMGPVRAPGFWARFAMLSGLPSSLWSLKALRGIPLWVFSFSRPLVYLGILMVSGQVAIFLDAKYQVGVALVLVALGHTAFWGAKRLSARAIWKPGDEDDAMSEAAGDPPILFLRSFEDDQVSFRPARWRLFRRWLQLWAFRRNVDEVLVDEVAQFGPVVALGRPGESVPPYGARRHYATHESWQQTIETTARNAQAIVLGAGASEGVLWEYDLIAREGYLGKTVVLFPPSTAAGEHRNEVAGALDTLRLFVQRTGLEISTDVPEGYVPVAVVPTVERPLLLIADSPTGAACVTAIRAHLLKTPFEDLSDPLSDFRGEPRTFPDRAHPGETS